MKTMRPAAGLLAAVCLLLWTQTVLADEFSISKNIAHQNWKPSVACNPATGNLVVAWEQMEIASKRRVVYAAFCKYKGNGSFKVSKPKLLSENKGSNRDPSVAFDGASGNYLVVWTKYELSGLRFGRDNIAARKLNAKGKPAGKEFLLTTDAEAHNDAAIIMPSAGAAGGPAKSPAFLLIWRHMPPSIDPGNNTNGLWTVQLDSGGSKMSEAVQVFRMGRSDTLGELYFNNAVTGKGGNRVLLYTVGYSQGEFEHHLLELDPYGNQIREVLVTKELLPRLHIATLSSKLYALSWQNYFEAEMSHQLLKATFKKKGKPFKSDINSSLTAIGSIALEGGGANIIGFGDTNRNAFFCTFNAKGKPVGEPKIVAMERAVCPITCCLSLPDGKVLLVSYDTSLDDPDICEVIGMTMDLP